MSADSSVLFLSRVLFVTGKGGTGKTALSAAIGRLAAAQGRHTVVVEVDNQRPSLPVIFGREPVYDPMEVEPNLAISNITWTEALEDWVEGIVSMRRLVRLIMKNRVVTLFLTVTPGARDLVVLWRIMQLAQRYDTVVVDMPASGNAVSMLSVPHTAERLFRAGPIRACADDLLAMYRWPGTRLVLVALPEEMVVNETVETLRKLRTEVPGMQVPMIALNRASPPTLTEREVRVLDALLELPLDGLASEVVGAGVWEARLEDATAEAMGRLATETALPVGSFPMLVRADSPARVVAQLAAALARASSVPVRLRGDAA